MLIKNLDKPNVEYAGEYDHSFFALSQVTPFDNLNRVIHYRKYGGYHDYDIFEIKTYLTKVC